MVVVVCLFSFLLSPIHGAIINWFAIRGMATATLGWTYQPKLFAVDFPDDGRKLSNNHLYSWLAAPTLVACAGMAEFYVSNHQASWILRAVIKPNKVREIDLTSSACNGRFSSPVRSYRQSCHPRLCWQNLVFDPWGCEQISCEQHNSIEAITPLFCSAIFFKQRICTHTYGYSPFSYCHFRSGTRHVLAAVNIAPVPSHMQLRDGP